MGTEQTEKERNYDSNTVAAENGEIEYSVFSLRTRRYMTYLLGFITLISTLTAVIYFPLVPMLSHHFQVSIQDINLTITAYVVCQAISPGIFASLADGFGRRPVVLSLLATYAAASLGLSLNRSSYTALIVLRALQSLGASATIPIAYGIVADTTIPAERGKTLGTMLAICNGISATGPLIGGGVALGTDGFAWVFSSLLVLSGTLLLITGLWMPETGRNIVSNGSVPPHGIWRTWSSFILHHLKYDQAEERDVSQQTIVDPEEIKWKAKNLLSALRILFYPDAAVILWMVATSYSVYYTIQTSIPVLYDEIYGYNSLEIGCAILPVLGGVTIGGMIGGRLLDWNYAATLRDQHLLGHSPPEQSSLGDFPIESARYRYYSPIVFAEVALVVGYGWAVQYHVHPAIPLVLQFFACATCTVLMHTANALLVDVFPRMSSTAYASGQIARCGLSAVLIAILDPLTSSIGRGWFFTIFGLFVGFSAVFSVTISCRFGMAWRLRRQRGSQQR